MEKNAVLVIGSGGREHAIARALSKSSQVGDIYCAPGNAGMSFLGQPIDIKITDHTAVIRFIEEKNISLTIIGPEVPLVDGLADSIRASNHLVVGASRQAAQLEGSKIFAKNFMATYTIPTAAFRVFDDATQAKEFARSPEGRHYRVLKADGLAAGKGVIIAKSTEELVHAIHITMAEKRFGAAGDKIILEELMQGPEVSLIALTDGKTMLPFPASQDHKRIYDHDKGPNTGGMGAYAPTPFYNDTIRTRVNKDILENFLLGLKSEKLEFRGIIYIGLMLTKQGPKVLEFNVRLGDPEAEVVLPLIKSDLYEAFMAVAKGELANVNLEIKPDFACTIVLASKGYPNDYKTGFPIRGLDDVEKEDQLMVFHAGTKKQGTSILTNGGRVLAVTGLGKSLDMAVVRAYQGVKKISFKDMHYRTDIAAKALRNRRIPVLVKRSRERQDKSKTLLMV